jgi:serine/threonine-protein kinase RsbW
MNLSRRYECIARPDQLPALLGFLDAACVDAELPDDVVFAVRLAAEEACTNVIMHGYRGREPGPVCVAVTREDQRVVVTVEDRGIAFDMASAPAPVLDAPAEERAIGGLGLHLIRNVMDEVHQQHDASSGNTLTLIKHIPPAHAAHS